MNWPATPTVSMRLANPNDSNPDRILTFSVPPDGVWHRYHGVIAPIREHQRLDLRFPANINHDVTRVNFTVGDALHDFIPTYTGPT